MSVVHKVSIILNHDGLNIKHDVCDKRSNRNLNKFSVERKDYSGERVWRISPFVYTTYARWTVIITTTTTIIYDLYYTYFIPINNNILYCTENETIVKRTHIYANVFSSTVASVQPCRHDRQSKLAAAQGRAAVT